MFTIASLRQLYQHMEWADALIWSAVMASDAASAEPAMLDKLRHLHGTQQYFLKVWLGQELTYDKSDTTLEDELELARAWHGEARAFLEELDDEALSRELSLPWADRFAKRAGAEHAHPTRLGETLYQVVAHSTYHRGQANTLLRQAGVTPPLADYIAWLWLGTPEPRWP
jgi:uncharacterized damage-inducible protein DinB